MIMENPHNDNGTKVATSSVEKTPDYAPDFMGDVMSEYDFPEKMMNENIIKGNEILNRRAESLSCEDGLSKYNEPEGDVKELCRECVIRDIEGCLKCGIFMYTYKHRYFDIKVQKRFKLF